MRVPITQVTRPNWCSPVVQHCNFQGSSNFRVKQLPGTVDLPKLPVPSLETTLSKYLQMARVLLTDSQYERTRAAVRAFGGPSGIGQRLQRFLVERQQTEDNWAYEWWLNDMYLNNTLPLPINSNPGMVMPPRQWIGPHDQARFAARLATSLLVHKHLLDRRGVPQERATSREKGQPLCMSQFYRLLTSYRNPGQPRDVLITEPCISTFDEHVVVACRNQFFVVLVKRGGQVVPEDEVAAQIQSIINQTGGADAAPAIGLLTAERRDVWANVREHLIQYESNRQNVCMLERSLAIFCMDEALPPSFNYGSLRDSASSYGHVVGARDETNMAHQMLHGGGSALNSANRWFDKTIQLVVSNDGVWGLCYEHSPAEGVAVVQLLEWLLEQSRDCSSERPLPRPPLRQPQAMQWQMTPRLHRHIQDAAKNLDSLLEDLDFYVYRYTGYGKEFIKSCKVSPDAYIQLALQLAFYRLNQRLTATYESASTRRFRLGRVDCIRSASLETSAWADAMCQAEIADVEAEGRRVTFSVADEKRVSLFDAAVARQTQEMVDNILGQGIDIHLLGLRQAARVLGEPESQIFLDEAFAKMNHFALSTSQVTTGSDSFMGYGPVVPDGYGASYNPRADSITFCLSAFHSSDVTSTWQFAHSLQTSLNNMRQLLATRNNAN